MRHATWRAKPNAPVVITPSKVLRPRLGLVHQDTGLWTPPKPSIDQRGRLVTHSEPFGGRRRGGTGGSGSGATGPAGWLVGETPGSTTVDDQTWNVAIPSPVDNNTNQNITGAAGWQVTGNDFNGTQAGGTALGYAGLATGFDGVPCCHNVLPAGFTGGGYSPCKLHYSIAGGLTEIYWCMEFAISNPFEDHTSGVRKMCFLVTSGEFIYIQTHGSTAGGYTLMVTNEQTGCPGNMRDNAAGVGGTATPISLGARHIAGWYVKYATTNGGTDGICKTWLDGVLQMNTNFYTNTGTFSEAQKTPYYGGVQGAAKTFDDSVDWYRDHLSHP